VMHKVGDLVAVVRYAHVVNVYEESLDVKDADDDAEFSVRGKKLIDSLQSADYFLTTEKVTKTVLAEKISMSFNTPMTVCFDKQNGEERVLRGRLKSSEPLMGRSYMEDLDIKKGKHNLRLVDNRTLKWAVVGGTKYEVK
jgi:hypothetical protein